MVSQKWNLVGKVKEARGLRGEVYVLVFSATEFSWRNITTVGLGDLPRKGSAAIRPPEQIFELERQRPFKDGIIAKLRGCDDRNAAEYFRGRGVYVQLSEMVALNQPLASRYVGYKVQEQTGHSEWGKILKVVAQAGQEILILVDSSGNEREIPYVESWIQDIRSDEKVIVMTLPEGLFDLNLKGDGN